MDDFNSPSFSLLGKHLRVPKKPQKIHTSFVDDREIQAQNRMLKYYEFIEKLSKDLVMKSEMLNRKRSSPALERESNNISRKKSPNKLSENNSGFGSFIEKLPPIGNSGASPLSFELGKEKNSIDFNRKGYGNGFLSKIERFNYLPYLNTGPGPGQYVTENNESPASNLKLDKSFQCSPPKVTKAKKVRPIPHKDVLPGPGEYNIEEKPIGKHGPSYKSVFVSLSPRTLDFAK